MKALILKDLYNISHNAKQMLVILIFFAVCFIPSSGVYGYAVAACFLCSMMIVTTFSFDQMSHWEKYALILPITKKDYIKGKFVVTAIFTSVGAVFALILGTVTIPFLHKNNVLEAFLSIGIGMYIGLIFGFLSIMFVIKFGVENARTITMLVVAVPVVLITLIVLGVKKMGVKISDVERISGTVPIAVWIFLIFAIFFFIFAISYKMSLYWFSKKEW